jgi:predicted methyltransferase
MINKILHGDCLQLMKDIPDKSIDMILDVSNLTCNNLSVVQ